MEGKAKTTVIGIIPQYSQNSKNNVFARILMPPVGIISVLSQINSDPRLNVYAIDENNYAGPRDFTDMPDHSFLQGREPAKIALFYGGMTNSIPRMFSVAKQYKKSGAVTIAGGSHVDALPEEALRSGVDIVVHGEGEETIQELLDVLMKPLNGDERDRALMQIEGISFLDTEKGLVSTGKREHIKDLDGLRATDLTIIKFLKKRWSAIPINRGRGCNFNCEFCVVNKQYGRYKAGSIERAMEQVVRYSDMGYRSFFFTDDNFAQDPKEAKELCLLIGDYKRKFRKKISLTVQVRNEVANQDQLIEAMKYAGVETLCIGYESPINEELKSMRKGVTVELLVERSRKLSESFYLHGMFIFGYPTFKDSKYRSDLSLEQKAKAYLRFFKDARIDTIQVFNAVPLPGSELRAKLESEGRLFPPEMVWWDKYDGLFLTYDPTPEGLDPYELQTIPRTLMKKRYMGNIVSRTLNYGNWLNWAYNATVGFPIQFSVFYTGRFVRNLVEKKRRENIEGCRSIFHASLIGAWADIKRKWRNLAVRTYGGKIMKRWIAEYEKGDYLARLKRLPARRV